MAEKMDDELKSCFLFAKNFAISIKDPKLRVEHMVLAILKTDNSVSLIIKEYVLDYELLLNQLTEHIKIISENDPTIDNDSILLFDKNIKKLVDESLKKSKNSVLTLDGFFINLLESNENEFIIKTLDNYNINEITLKEKLKKIKNMYYEEDFDGKKNDKSQPKKDTKSKTPILDSFSRDLTNLAMNGKIDPVIGRNTEVNRVAQILSRKKKNNPVLIGDPGVGKTSIAESLALLIVKNECPLPLQNKRLVSLDLTSLVAGTKYRGQFEERVKGFLEEIKENKNIILFIDELHTLVGAGNSSGALDAANIFKPALARGEVQCIGATTLDEYREYIEKDGALERRFQTVMVNPPTLIETKDILTNIKTSYEEFHKVRYTDEAISEIVRLADRYITNREFPDKAIDILDEAGSCCRVNLKTPENVKILEEKLFKIKKDKIEVVKNQKYELAADLRDLEKKTISELEVAKSSWLKNLGNDNIVVDVDLIYDVVSQITNIPINKLSKNDISNLVNLEDEINQIIIGQKEAVNKITLAIKRNKTGIRKQNKPIGSFLFVGSTGVGKTELAKVLANKVFGSNDSLIRVDMSEYGEKFNVSKLIGSPPGYIGFNEGGQLTEKVKNKPYSLILFDEVEKAHPDVFNLLLQLLDDGHLTDGSGRKINFKNTVIIMTSNIGVSDIQDSGNRIGFSLNNDDNTEAKDIINKSLKKFFRPEFLNRLDDIIFFNFLNKDDMSKIVDLRLNDLRDRLSESNHTFKISKSAKNKLGDLGYDKNFGARELSRVIQKYIEDPISDLLLKNNLPEHCNFNIDYDKKTDKIIVNIA